MATVSLSSTLYSTYRTKLHTSKVMPSCSLTIPIRTFNFQIKLALKNKKQKWGFNGMRVLRSSEEETLITEQETEAVEETVAADEQQPVAVPVSPSDKLTMYFQVLMLGVFVFCFLANYDYNYVPEIFVNNILSSCYGSLITNTEIIPIFFFVLIHFKVKYFPCYNKMKIFKLIFAVILQYRKVIDAFD